MRLTLLALAQFALASPVPADTSLWLLSGPDCNICSIYEQVAADRGYGDRLKLDGQTYPIRRADKRELPPLLAEYFAASIADDEHWPIQLTVAVTEKDRVVYAANVAESVDWRDGRIAARFMDPPATESEEALHDYGFDYADHFRRHINLEYFVARASGAADLPYREGAVRVAPAAELRSDKRVSIWGAARRHEEDVDIRQLVEHIGRSRLFLTYTNGDDTSRRDTLVLDAGEYRFVRSDLAADFPGDFQGIDAWFSHIASADAARHLVIHVGHSGPTGLPVWGHALSLSPEALGAAIEATGKRAVLVSGGCHSGLFAGAAQCGFFAAHPQVIATGCQRSYEAVQASDDYLKFFFLVPSKAQDADGDGMVSFREAHWYAATQVERHNIVYSDGDLAVDRYFAEHADQIPEGLTLGALRTLVERLPAAERAAFESLSAGLADDITIGLTDHVTLNQQALDALDGATETSSESRNANAGLPYPLNLVGLARRAVYVGRGNALDADALACGEQAIDDYLAAW